MSNLHAELKALNKAAYSAMRHCHNASGDTRAMIAAVCNATDKLVDDNAPPMPAASDLTKKQRDLLAALASTSGRKQDDLAASMTRNGRDLGEAIEAASLTLMHNPAYRG